MKRAEDREKLREFEKTKMQIQQVTANNSMLDLNDQLKDLLMSL